MFAWIKTASAADAGVVTGAVAGVASPVLGIDPAIALAGTIGAFASLAFIRFLTARIAVTSVLCGIGAAFYITVPLTDYLVARWQLPPDAKLAIAFLLGLVGMNLLAGVVHYAQKFRRDPAAIVKELK